MKGSRIRLCRLIPLAFLLIPPVLWALVLSITPTEWARTRIVAKLADATGRSISLGRLRIGILGGVTLTDLTIGSPGSSHDPWLKANSARIDVSVLQLLAGQVDPSEVRVDGLSLRVLRRRDGSLELADLLRSRSTTSTASTHHRTLPTLDIHLTDAHVDLIDEPSRTRLELTSVEGHATWHQQRTAIHELRGTLNRGTFELNASFDRTPVEPAFEGHFHAEAVALDQDSNALIYLIPILSRIPEARALEGRLSTQLDLRGQGTDRSTLRRTLVGRGSVSLDPISLDGSRLLAELADLIDLPKEDRTGVVKSDFVIKRGRILSENMSLVVARVPISLSGWTDFQGDLDYRVRSDALVSRLPNKAREWLSDLSIDVSDVSALHVKGSLDAMKVTLDHRLLDPVVKGPNGDRHSDERQKLRDLGRRFRERLLR